MKIENGELQFEILGQNGRQSWFTELEEFVKDAYRQGKWLRLRNTDDCWLAPEELAKKMEEGRFVWGVCNWELTEPKKPEPKMKTPFGKE